MGCYSFLMWHRDTVRISEVNSEFTVTSVKGTFGFIPEVCSRNSASDDWSELKVLHTHLGSLCLEDVYGKSLVEQRMLA